MKYLRFILLLAALVLGVLAAAAQEDSLAPQAIDGEAVYIPFPVRITLDGDLSDWAGVPSTTVTSGTLLSDDPAENGSFTFQAAADAENFYIAMTMPDQNIIAGQHGTDFWNEDSLEFYLNLSGDRFAPAYSDAIFQININAADIGNSDPTAITVTGTNGINSGVQALVFTTADGWGFEAAVPIAGYITPEHGLEIGLQAHANGASESDRDVKLIWSNADTIDNSWNDPSLFGSGLFFEIGSSDIPMPSERPEPATPEPTAPPERAASVNQVGYLTNATKTGVTAGEVGQEAAWQLLDAATETVIAEGTTSTGKQDEASGDAVLIADFSAVTTPGTYVLVIDGARSVPFQISDDLYAALKVDALRYFYLNRSGTPLEAQYAGEWSRPAGHVTDNAVTCWQGTDPQGKAWEGCGYTLDAAGGWYDAGDYGKYVVNGGITTWTLQNLYERLPEAFPDGAANIPESGNGISDLLDESRWEMEWLLSMQVPAGEPLAGMAHHKLHDAVWAGMPVLPPTEYDNNSDFAQENTGRYLMPPSTAATLNLAATAAQCARIWRDIDGVFAERCLTAAETAWQAAHDNPVMLAGNVPGNGGGNYDDTNVDDEFYWAAAELFITTGEPIYLDALEESRHLRQFPMSGTSSMYWGDTAALGSISLVSVPNDLPEERIASIKNGIVRAADFYLAVQSQQGYPVNINVSGYVWGSNSGVLNNALVMALAHDFTGDARYLNGARQSMDYILGENSLGVSFVAGYGTRAMLHPHHRFWGNSPQRGFPPPPPGAIAGGPNAQPSDPPALESNLVAQPPAKRYMDDIESYSTNEVAINWNAPLVWVSAYLNAIKGT